VTRRDATDAEMDRDEMVASTLDQLIWRTRDFASGRKAKERNSLAAADSPAVRRARALRGKPTAADQAAGHEPAIAQPPREPRILPYRSAPHRRAVSSRPVGDTRYCHAVSRSEPARYPANCSDRRRPFLADPGSWSRWFTRSISAPEYPGLPMVGLSCTPARVGAPGNDGRIGDEPRFPPLERSGHRGGRHGCHIESCPLRRPARRSRTRCDRRVLGRLVGQPPG
jgi:hypothetical protein